MSDEQPGIVIAILAANGFEEHHITEMQRGLTRLKIPYKILSPEQALVNGWQGNGWGHYFTVDAAIGTVLGSDYDALVLPGGERGVARLKGNPHTRRIVNHFLEAGKPIAAIADGVALLALSPRGAGVRVAAGTMDAEALQACNLTAVDEPMTQQGAVLSAAEESCAAWVEAALEQFASLTPVEAEGATQQAA